MLRTSRKARNYHSQHRYFRYSTTLRSNMLRELQTFLAVRRWGTFTAAAKGLGMTQSAVSDHMQRLEEFTGVQLFPRTGRSATLNAAGDALLPLAEEAMQLTERMRARSGAG